MPERRAGIRRLGYTIAGLMAAFTPHVLHLRPWVTGCVLALCTWRLLAERRGWRLPGVVLRSLIALGATVGVLAGYATITGLDAGTALLALMAALKLLETRSPRDHVVLIFIGWFLCLSTLLYAQSIPAVAWVLPTLWLLAAALLEVARRGEGGPSPAPFRTAGAMLVKALPLAAVLFLFFPRIAGSFWGAPSAERATTGLTEELSPGDISKLTLNDTVAFRVRFAGPPPPPRQRYWRGPVLTEFDGHTWSRGGPFDFRQPARRLGQPVDYTVTLEPTGQRMLFALDLVDRWPAELAAQSWDYQLRTRYPIHAVLQYQARSYPGYRAGESLSPALWNLHLQLPPGRNPRTLRLARAMRAAALNDGDYARAVLAMFREQEFFYTLTPPGLERDSVDDFLFHSRRGFCEHFASAFTAMMRAAGIPARVVGGYQGGDWNPVGGYLILRQSHAHAWSEIWLPGNGWTRVDPTAAVAPARVERGLEAALADPDLLPGRLLRESRLLWRAGMIWDSFNAHWNDWIVQFNRRQQEDLLRAAGFADPDWHELALVLGIGLGATLLLLSAWLAWEVRPGRLDPAAASYRRFEQRLARAGIERPAYEAPYHFAARVRRLRPDLGPAAAAVTDLYLRLRYLPAPAAGDLRLLRGLVRRFAP